MPTTKNRAKNRIAEIAESERKAAAKRNGHAKAPGNSIERLYASTKAEAERTSKDLARLIRERFPKEERALLLDLHEREMAAARKGVQEAIDEDVKDFRAGFDENKIVEELGHTPNAMVGAIVDSERSKHEAPKATKNGSANGKPAAPGVRPGRTANCDPAELFESRPCFLIELSSIESSPDNARKTFDPAKLASLAESLKAHGQETPCKVRPSGAGHYELIAGERRFRAAKLARFSTLRCEIVEAGDAEARERGLVENLQREDLNPIERAAGYKQLLDDGKTQKEVAELLGLSGQAAVSNAVRLLELPDEIGKRVASGQIEATVATMLVPHCRRPVFVEAFLKVAANESWELDVRDLGISLHEAAGKCAHHLPMYPDDRLKLAKKHAKEIDLAEIDGGWFVFNKPEWLRILREKAAKEKTSAKGKSPKAKKKRSPVSDQQERWKREEKERDLRLAVAQGLLHWLVPRIVAFVPKSPATFCAKYVLSGALHRGDLGIADNCHGRDGDMLVKAAKAIGLPFKWRASPYGERDLARLSELSGEQLRGIEVKLVEMDLSAMLKGDGFDHRAQGYVPRAAILARDAGIDWEKDWRPTREFLELFDAKELRAIAGEWGLAKNWKEAVTKQEAVDTLLAWSQERRLAPPDVVRQVIKGKE